MKQAKAALAKSGLKKENLKMERMPEKAPMSKKGMKEESIPMKTDLKKNKVQPNKKGGAPNKRVTSDKATKDGKPMPKMPKMKDCY